MHKIDWRLLLMVVCALVTAAAAVRLTRHTEVPSVSLTEAIPSGGRPLNDVVRDGLQLQVNATGITMTLPGCQLHQFQDTFFVHVYTDEGLAKTPATYANLDFALTQQAPKVLTVNGVKHCVYQRSIREFKPRQLNMGQFTTPGGRCCEIVWSRSYVFAPEPSAAP